MWALVILMGKKFDKVAKIQHLRGNDEFHPSTASNAVLILSTFFKLCGTRKGYLIFHPKDQSYSWVTSTRGQENTQSVLS